MFEEFNLTDEQIAELIALAIEMSETEHTQ